MRAIIAFLIATLAFLAFASTANAQILNRLKNRAKKAAENKVEEKISNEVEKAAEEAVEKSWQSIFGEDFGSEGDGVNVSFAMNSNAATEDVYTFDVVTTMEVESHTDGEESDGPMIMKMHFSDVGSYSGTQFSGEEMDNSEGEMFMIYDLKNESMVMLMDSEDGKYSFAYDWKKAQSLMQDFEKMEKEYEMDSEEESDIDSEPEEMQNVKEIGTKSIAGLECRGYLSESDGTRMEYWVTEEQEDLGVYKMLRINEQTKELRGNVPENYPSGGMLMEMTQEDLNSGQITTMKVTDINKNASVSYSMSDYPPMSFSTK
jgi:hypothetical protein